MDGKLLYELKGHTWFVNHIVYSPDGKTLATASSDQTARIWSINGKLIHELKGHTLPINYTTYSPNGNILATGSNDNSVRIWDINGNLLNEIKEIGWVTQIVFSSDGKTLITRAAFDAKATIWTVDGKKIHELKSYSRRGQIIYSVDGKTLIDIFNGARIRSIDGKILHELREHSNGINYAAYSPDGGTIATASSDNIVRLWSSDGKLSYELKEHSYEVTHITYAPDGRTFATGSDVYGSKDKSARIWDVKGKLLHILEGHTSGITRVTYSPVGTTLATASFDGTAKIWSMDGKLLHNLKGHKFPVGHLIYSPNGKTLVTAATMDETARIWSSDGKLLYELKDNLGSAPTDLKYSPDGTNLAIAYSDNIVRIWSSEGKLLYKLSGHSDSIDFLMYSSNGNNIITGSKDNTIRIWSKSGISIQELKGHTGGITSLYLLNKGKILVSSSYDNTIKYWDWDGIVRADDVKTHGRASLLATQMFFDDNSSLVYTPDGHYDYQGHTALDYVSFRSSSIQNGFIELQDLREDYYYEGLMNDILSGSFKPNKKKSVGLAKSVETVPIIKPLFEEQKKLEFTDATQSFRFQVKENGSELNSVVAFVNGIQVAQKSLDESDDSVNIVNEEKENFKTYQFKIDLPLIPGSNRVELKAYNKEKIPQSYPVFELQRKVSKNEDSQKPNLYILSVGVNEYQKNKLQYSKADALAISDLISKNSKELYGNIFTTNLLDEKATKKGIEAALSAIVSKARPEDVVLIYLSGHGMNAFTREGKKIFYFVPQDFPWPNDPENENVATGKGITADYLNEVFTKIKSHKVVLILDACHSGSANVAFARGGENEKATRKAMEKMANGTGRFIFASSSGSEASREHKEVGHGLYTYVSTKCTRTKFRQENSQCRSH
ncbi:MAG: caspase family protein [Leptospiraceae bacterium]|nr:caspase family protein [Leptospiraceae bacterium]